MRGVYRYIFVLVLVLALAVSVIGAKDDEAREIMAFCEVVSSSGSFSGISLPTDATFFDKVEDELPAETDDAETDDTDVNPDENNTDGEGAEEESEKPEREKLKPEVSEGSVKEMSYGESDYYSCSPKKGEESIEIIFDMKDRVTDNPDGKLGVGIFVIGFGKGEAARYCALNVTVVDGDGKSVTAIPALVNTASVLYLDMSAADETEKMKISVSCDDDFDLKSVRVTEPFVTENHDFGFQSVNGIMWMSVLEGRVKTSADSIDAFTGKGSVSVAVGGEKYVRSDSDECISYLSVGSTKGAASVTATKLGINSEELLSLAVQENEPSSLFRVGGGMATGTLVTVKTGSEENVTLDELKLYSTTEKAKTNIRPMTELSVVDGELHAEGRINSDTVKNNRKGYVGIFMERADGNGEAIQIGKADVYSKYSFDIPLEDYPHAVSDCMFYVAVVDSDGDVHQVSDKRFVSVSRTHDPAKSLYGLYGVDPVSVYEAAAPRVMVDIDISRLTDTTSLNDMVMSRGGYAFGVNSDYLREIDTHMEFYAATDVSVYVRLICSSEIRSKNMEHLLTYRMNNGEVMIRTDDPEGANLYMALGAFLCNRYPGIVSFVLSSGVNSEKSTGHISVDPYKGAADVAMAARLLYGAASEVSDVFITVPFAGESDKETASPEVFAALMSERFMQIGSIPWAVLMTDSEAELPVLGDSIIASQRFNGVPTSDFSVYCWEPETSDKLIETYNEVIESSSTSTVRIVFLSEKNLTYQLEREDLNKLKHLMKSDDVLIIDNNALPMGEDELSKIKGSAYMWDFSSAQSKLGWFAGYGIDYLASAIEGGLSSGSDKCVLRGLTERSDENIAGIMLCRHAVPMNLSEAPYVEFVYSYESLAPAQIVFVFGNGENRAEFTVSPTVSKGEDGKYKAVCDLSEFSRTLSVAYVGIIVYSSESVIFDLSSVRAMSSTLTDAKVKELVTVELPEEPREIPRLRLTVAGLIVLFVITVTVRILTVTRRHDKTLVNVVKRRRRFMRYR